MVVIGFHVILTLIITFYHDQVAKRMVLEFAASIDPEMHHWISVNVA